VPADFAVDYTEARYRTTKLVGPCRRDSASMLPERDRGGLGLLQREVRPSDARGRNLETRAQQSRQADLFTFPRLRNCRLMGNAQFLYGVPPRR
jgi:hypothetical protein